MFTFEEPSRRPDTAATVANPADRGVMERGGERWSAAPPASLLDPVYVGRAVWASKPLIAATTVLGLTAAVLVAATTPKLYVATAQILMDPRDLKVVANEVTPNGLPSEATLALVESQTAVILSSNILSRVVAKGDLKDDAEFNGKRKSGLASLLPPSAAGFFAEPEGEPGDRENRTIARLRRAMTVARETKSFVINLSVGSSDPGKAARLANLVADVFIDEQGRVQSDTARRATAALTSRLSELRRSVVETENNVETYKSRNALIGVGGKLVDDEYITRINDQLAKARGDITSLRVKADSMRAASVDDVVRGTLPEEQNSQILARLRQGYSDLAQQNAALATKLGPRHPQRIASEGALASTRQAIAAELGRIVAGAQTELARAEATERNLTSQIDALKNKQVATSGAFVKLRELEREVDASRAVYEAFLQRARETSEQENLNTANVRVISDATPPLQTSGLSRKVVVAAGGIAGLLGGIALAASFAMVSLLKAFFAGERRPAVATRPALERAAGSDDLASSPALSERSEGSAAPAFGGQPDRSTPQGAPAVVAPETGTPGERPASGEALSQARPAANADAPDESRAGPGPALAPQHASSRARDILREQIRALSAAPSPDLAENDEARQDGTPRQEALPPPVLDPEVAMLRDEVDTVKNAIAEIRRQRASRATLS